MEGRCSYCGHIRGLYDGRMVQHTYLGSEMCPGSFKDPKKED